MGASASIIASIEEVQYSIPNNLSTTKPIAWTGARTKNEWKVPVRTFFIRLCFVFF